jgi:uncharacterized membrane protein
MTKKLIPPTLEEFKKQRPPLRNVKKEIVQKMSKQDRIALWITNRIGTMGFFLIIVVWTFLWLGWNLLAPEPLRFDPPMGFVLWLFISNLIQIFLMPMIMVGQNVQERHADARAENDLEVNIKAEKEIEVILHHLEYQNAILIAMLEKQGINLEDALAKASHK